MSTETKPYKIITRNIPPHLLLVIVTSCYLQDHYYSYSNLCDISPLLATYSVQLHIVLPPYYYKTVHYTTTKRL